MTDSFTKPLKKDLFIKMKTLTESKMKSRLGEAVWNKLQLLDF